MYIYAFMCTNICINIRLVNPQDLDLIFILCIYFNCCPRTFTAPRKITCVLLSKASLRSAEELARPARPELLRDQFCDFVLSAADCPADEEGDDRDRHGDNPRYGPRR